MNKKAAQALNVLITKLESAEKFVLKQAPEVCREIIAKERVEAAVQLAQSLSLYFVSYVAGEVAWYLYHQGVAATAANTERWGDPGFPYYLGTTLVGVMSVIALMCASAVLLDATRKYLLSKYTPKLIIISELRRMVKR